MSYDKSFCKPVSQLYLGVDGGGTKTICIAIDRDGKRLGCGRAESSNRNSVGDADARKNLASAINLALDDAARMHPSSAKNVSAICLGMSGVGRADDRALVASWVEEILPGVPQQIQNDAVIALASGTKGALYGIVIISGTGMIAYGFDAHGREERVGGWGPQLGEGGSGYAIGAALLHAVTAAVDGTGPPTALQEALLHKLALQSPQELIPWAYAEEGWHHIAALAPLVFEQAQADDAVATRIIEDAVSSLVNSATALLKKLDFGTTNFPIVLAGGLMKRAELYKPLKERLLEIAPHATITKPQIEPVEGAALLALRMEKITQVSG